MRMRRKKWAEKELRECDFYYEWPEEDLSFKDRFKKQNNNDNTKDNNNIGSDVNIAPIHIELGCGKGNFISKLASQHLDINYIAVDMIEAMLGLTKRNIEYEYSKLPINQDVQVTFDNKNKKYNYSKQVIVPNLVLIRENCEYINKVLDENDSINRIYINFCNPWPKGKHQKRRLTHPRQLAQYKKFLAPNGEIFFKTDDDELFEASLEYFNAEGFNIISKTYDLVNDDIFAKYPNGHANIITEHEQMFTNEGVKIKALICII